MSELPNAEDHSTTQARLPLAASVDHRARWHQHPASDTFYIMISPEERERLREQERRRELLDKKRA